jgi:hypothetical protein
MHAQREKAVNLSALERIWPAISASWVSTALPDTRNADFSTGRPQKGGGRSGTYAELPSTGPRPAALLAAEWRIPFEEPEISGHGNQIVKALTMIKGWLPIRFLSIRQTNRMGFGSRT